MIDGPTQHVISPLLRKNYFPVLSSLSHIIIMIIICIIIITLHLDYITKNGMKWQEGVSL